MRILWLERDYQKTVMGLKGKRPDLSRVEHTVEDEDTAVIAPDRRSIVAILLVRKIARELHRAAFEDWYAAANQLPGNRPAATGVPSLPWGTRKHVLQVLRKRGYAYAMLGFVGGRAGGPPRKTALYAAPPRTAGPAQGVRRASGPVARGIRA